ncbi:MAG: glycogen/starch synthase [Eubacteriales bacterium]|nr:glycogen/starch synthase [Eubacteriales bacterium]
MLYCSPEVRPFSGTGGLSEVAGSLPKALCQSGKIDCRVITPLYRSIPRKYRDKMEFLGWTMIPVAWRTKYMGVFSMEWDGVLCYFIDNEEYFDRDGLYGYYNDCERFAFFSRAVFESLRLTGFTPDIVHANDWQTAMVPVYQDAIYHRRFLTTVFTIHNIEYQGSYGKEVIRDVLGLPEGSEHLVEYGDGVNLLKGGIDTANLVSTVSPTYASELRDPISAFGLDGIVRASYGKFRGILNGIDTDSYNPASDPIIAANYTPEDPSGKEICHSHLQKLAGLPEKNVPILSLISRLVPAKGMDLLRETLDRILSEEDVQLIVLGTGFPEYEDFFRGLEARWPEKVRSWITFNIGRSHEIYAGSDIFLMPSRSEPCGLSQMIAMRYGTVPVVRATGGLRDSVKDCTFGDGTGFVFDEYSGDAFYNAVMQALALKRNTENWEKLKIHDMKQDFSWKHSAEEYIQMYEQVRYH